MRRITILIILLAATTFFGFKWYMLRKTVLKSCEYSLENFDFHFKNETDSPSIVMLGNSLIRQGDWITLFGRNDIQNRGISGDRVNCMIGRLKFIERSPAKVIVIEGGINDVLRHVPADSIGSDFKKLITRVQKLGKIPVVNLIIHLAPKALANFKYIRDLNELNQEITVINNQVRTWCQLQGIQVVDMNDELSRDSELLDQYSTDGIHLTAEAYQLWVATLKTSLDTTLQAKNKKAPEGPNYE
ncbi:MAG: GDSL-type esterase/lipase family protein [Chryseolinea sp.]